MGYLLSNTCHHVWIRLLISSSLFSAWLLRWLITFVRKPAVYRHGQHSKIRKSTCGRGSGPLSSSCARKSISLVCACGEAYDFSFFSPRQKGCKRDTFCPCDVAVCALGLPYILTSWNEYDVLSQCFNVLTSMYDLGAQNSQWFSVLQHSGQIKNRVMNSVGVNIINWGGVTQSNGP